jgi:hypothetical protein
MIYTIEMMEPIFYFIDRLNGIKQAEKHHPEGCVLTHTLQVINLAFRETTDTDLILASMLHDIGKYENSIGHEQIAVEWLHPYCSVKTLWLIEHHMRIWYYLFGTMKKLGKCKELAEHPWLSDLIQLCRWDYAGRKPNIKPKYDKSLIIEKLNKATVQHFYAVQHFNNSFIFK